MKDLKKWHNEQIKRIGEKLGVLKKMELYKKCGVSRASVSLWLSSKKLSKKFLEKKYKNMIMNYYEDLSPVELIDRIKKAEAAKLHSEIERLKMENSRLREELGGEEHY